jgi:hypothetical protein
MFLREYVRYNPLIGGIGTNFRGGSLPGVVDFLLPFDGEAGARGRSISDERAQIGAGTGACVVDRVGVVRRHLLKSFTTSWAGNTPRWPYP